MKFFNTIKKITKKLTSKTFVAASVVALGAGLAFGAVQAEFYPDRQPFDYNKPCDPTDADIYDRCGSLTGPVFNSFINTPSYGDERAFADARRTDQTALGSYKNVLPDVTEGASEIVIRTYVHNNASTSTNASGLGIAKDAKVRIALPSATSNVLRARSYISASNAALVEDTVDFTAAGNFKLEYIDGSAIMYNNGPFKDGTPLSDNIVTTGAAIGYDALNGDLPGCFDYEAVVQIRVKVIPVEEPKTSFDKQVRIKGDKEWKQVVEASPGDTVQWLMTTNVTGGNQLDHIVVRDVAAPSTELVKGTVKRIDGTQNQTLPDAPLFDGGFDMGSYGAGSGFYTMYDSTILGDFEGCERRVRNLAFVKSTQNPSELESSADVIITKENCEEESFVTCDSLSAPKLTLKKGDSTEFTVSATATNTTISGYIFSVDGKVVQDSASNKYTFVAGDAGKYDVDVVVKSSKGNVSSEACVKTVDVVEEIVPLFRCDSFTLSKNKVIVNESVVAKVRVTAKDGATFKMATFTFGDEKSASDKFVTNNIKDGVVTAKHSYAKAGDYGPRVKLDFEVGGKTVTVEDSTCVGNVIVTGVVKSKKTIPDTGAGSTIAILLVSVAIAGSMLHRKLTLRNR